jgi:hypothetical protein
LASRSSFSAFHLALSASVHPPQQHAIRLKLTKAMDSATRRLALKDGVFMVVFSKKEAGAMKATS